MLKGKRIYLRPVERDDLARYVKWLNDETVNAHLTTFIPMNLDDEVEWYENQRHDSSTLNLAIVITTEEKHIGSVGLMKIQPRNQSAELGIVIGDKECWGQGYGQEAIERLVEFAFKQLNLNRIYLRVDAHHPAAKRCYEKSGFVEEGRLRSAGFRHGQFHDQFVMSILRSEYNN
ncbi:GNAT family protein [Anaerolineales bacterium HSG6]|nr:GNAT family protein [Anaerolineales bacterium HSG6]MDM8530565.1 GNAT family protein [Anaerolineales bacterium HSG25]